MMKFCARKAGMRYFSLGSEPICTVFHVLQNCDIKINNKGMNKFIVLDCGGGTIDASCIEVSGDRQSINELNFSETLFCGGLKVDEKFMKLLKELLPQELLLSMDNKPGEWVRQRHEFVNAKFTVPVEFDDYRM